MSAVLNDAYKALLAERDRIDAAIVALAELLFPGTSAAAKVVNPAPVAAEPPAPRSSKKRAAKVAPPRTPDAPKRGRLSNDEKATIARLHRQGTEPEAIAMSLDRPLATVQTAITTMQGEGVL